VSDGDSARSYLVECYWPGVSAEKFASTAKRVQAAASTLRREGRDVVFLGSILVPADESVFCLFDGVEADVRAASERGGIPFERVLESLRIDGIQTQGEEE
jgi:Protein of unknown function (DUF4242)